MKSHFLLLFLIIFSEAFREDNRDLFKNMCRRTLVKTQAQESFLKTFLDKYGQINSKVEYRTV
ncbi:hypothetical protein HW555_006661, partial [Spodoptera exigua]